MIFYLSLKDKSSFGWDQQPCYVTIKCILCKSKQSVSFVLAAVDSLSWPNHGLHFIVLPSCTTNKN